MSTPSYFARFREPVFHSEFDEELFFLGLQMIWAVSAFQRSKGVVYVEFIVDHRTNVLAQGLMRRFGISRVTILRTQSRSTRRTNS